MLKMGNSRVKVNYSTENRHPKMKGFPYQKASVPSALLSILGYFQALTAVRSTWLIAVTVCRPITLLNRKHSCALSVPKPPPDMPFTQLEPLVLRATLMAALNVKEQQHPYMLVGSFQRDALKPYTTHKVSR